MSGLLFILFLAASLSSGPASSKQQPTNPRPEPIPAQRDLRGVWRIIEQSSRTPGAAWTVAKPAHLSVYIFTRTHYSYMWTPGPRVLFAGDPNRPTDAEKAAAYSSFIAASGTYVLAGSALTLNAIITKNPNEMTGVPLNYTVEIGAATLRMTITNPPFAPGQERRTVLTRIE
jgi:hypothetical protein